MKKLLQRGTMWIFNVIIVYLIISIAYQFYHHNTKWFKDTRELSFEIEVDRFGIPVYDPALDQINTELLSIKRTIWALFGILFAKIALYIYWLPSDSPEKIFFKNLKEDDQQEN